MRLLRICDMYQKFHELAHIYLSRCLIMAYMIDAHFDQDKMYGNEPALEKIVIH